MELYAAEKLHEALALQEIQALQDKFIVYVGLFLVFVDNGKNIQ